MSERATLKDVINYEPEQYLSEDEMSLIRSTFKDNPRLIAVLRKLLWPTVTDAALPIEQMGNDGWNAGRDWAQIPADEAKILMCARQDAQQFIMGALIKLKVLANQTELTDVEKAYRQSKDSTK